MTDLQKFLSLYREFGMNLYPKINPQGNYWITIKPGDFSGFTGFVGIYTDIVFDRQGKFLFQTLYNEG